MDIKGQGCFCQENAKKFEEAVDELYDVVKRPVGKNQRKRERKIICALSWGK